MDEAGRRPVVLMAEDDAFIGLDLCDALIRGGFCVAGPMATNAEASAWIARTMPAVAILGVTLRDGPTAGLALTLRECGVPVLIHAESDSAAGRSASLAGTPWLPRPAWHQDVVDTTSALAAHAAQEGPEA